MTQPYQPAPFSAVPTPFGLYDPRFEHDACGVSFVVDIKGVASHDIVTDALGALCNLDHRGASGAEVNTGDGAGILIQVPDRFLRAVVDFDLPPAGAYGVGLAFLPLDPDGRRQGRRRDRGDRRRGGPAGRSAGATCPIDDSMIGPTALRVDARASASSSSPTPAWSATGHRARPQAVRRAQAHRARAQRRRRDGDARVYFPSLSCRTLVYKGMLTTPQLGGVLPRPRRRAGRVGAGAGAQPLLHQHVPVVAARPPVPLRRPQRRDQHRAGQPQLDAGPRGAAGHAAHPGTSSAPSRSARRARPTPPASTSASSCCTSAADRSAARRADDDPRGVGEPRHDARREAGVLPVPRVADGAVGRPGVDRVHRRHRRSARCSTATACARAATGSPTTTS